MKTLKLFCFALCLFTLISEFSFAQQFQVGHKQVSYQDPARNNQSVPVEIYYPATTAGDNVAVANGQFPIIVFGHGFMMAWSAYQNLWDSIVPKGYIMAFPTTQGSMSPNHGDFGLDLAFLNTKLKSEGALSTSFLYQKVATTSAISGHSMGGGSAFLAAKNNTQLTTLIVFAPANTTPSSITAAHNVTVPSVVFYGENDGVAPPADHQIPMYDSLVSSCKTRIGIIGGGHCYFANSNFYCSFGEGTTSPQPTITREEQQATVLSLLVPYLDYSLKGNATAGALFLSRLNSLSTISFARSCNTTSIENEINNLNNCFVLSPNPADNLITISINNMDLTNEKYDVRIVNITGQVVFERSQLLSSKNPIDISNLAKGIYMLQIKNEKIQKSEKIIIQ
jgi:dienelactone hydrolase